MSKHKFSWLKMVKKGVAVFVMFLLPWLVDQFLIAFPDIAQLTVGGLLVMLVNFLKNKLGLLKWL